MSLVDVSRAAVSERAESVRRTAHPEQIGANRDTIGKLAKVQVPGTATKSKEERVAIQRAEFRRPESRAR